MSSETSKRKVAMVTGSGTGVGAATALGLSRRGYDVVINYSKSEREAKETEALCRDAGAETLLARGNVAEDADCRNIVKAAVERWGRLDALVNNAGISTFTGSANWDALMQRCPHPWRNAVGPSRWSARACHPRPAAPSSTHPPSPGLGH
jgi:3-oxoacyl-[acyl-carrier protein] reductase